MLGSSKLPYATHFVRPCSGRRYLRRPPDRSSRIASDDGATRTTAISSSYGATFFPVRPRRFRPTTARDARASLSPRGVVKKSGAPDGRRMRIQILCSVRHPDAAQRVTHFVGGAGCDKCECKRSTRDMTPLVWMQSLQQSQQDLHAFPHDAHPIVLRQSHEQPLLVTLLPFSCMWHLCLVTRPSNVDI